MGRQVCALRFLSLALAAALVAVTQQAGAVDTPIDTTFTYQGYLEYGGNPVDNEECTINFTLWDAQTSGTQAGSAHEATVYPENGYFTTVVNVFNALGLSQFTGSKRWLQLAVVCENDPAYPTTTVLPRQEVTATPYAISLMPGAAIVGDVAGQQAFRVGNTSSGSFGTGIKADTSATQGTALYAESKSNSLSTTYGVYATANSRGGVGVYGESLHSSSTQDNIAYGGYFSANARDDRGVYGESTWGQGGGIGGEFKSAGEYGIGVEGRATHASGETYGVYGSSSSINGYGGAFVSASNVGVYAQGAVDLELGGDGVIDVRGHASSSLLVTTNGDITFYLDENNTDATSAFAIFDGGSLTPRFELDQAGDLTLAGNLYALGGTKSAVVSTEDYGRRALYAVESPGNWFEDFGDAQLSDGSKTVEIEPIFRQTVNTALDYHVFVTPLGDCALYVADKTPSNFTVRAQGGKPCDVAFDYRIVAKRAGFENARLDPFNR